jgi:N-acetylneuraminate synthase/sialic acid synthase
VQEAAFFKDRKQSMDRVFTIGGKVISDDSASFIIAEIGHNHQGDLEKCKAMFKAA